jgi:hypothetical protein
VTPFDLAVRGGTVIDPTARRPLDVYVRGGRIAALMREERRRMRDVLWRHSLDNDTVVVAIPVSEERLQRQAEPFLIRAHEEGLAVA